MDRARRLYETVFEVSPAFASKGWTTLNFGSFELALHILSPSIVGNGGAMTELSEG